MPAESQLTKTLPRVSCWALLILMVSGCSIIPPRFTMTSYRPTNVYRQSDSLPTTVQRVAVLPLTMTSSTPLLESGKDVLEPIFQAELQKARRFELVPVSPEQLEQWTGQRSWRSDEALPEEFFSRLRKGTGSDAVLFCQLTSYQPYPPLAIGWKLSLVANMEPGKASLDSLLSGKTSGILWSADETFNAGNAEVAHGAESYSAKQMRNAKPLADSKSILSSPTQFGRYTLDTLFDTLPTR